jgi:hypothetical protein
MASASPTTDCIAREPRDRSGETFEGFTGGTVTSVGTSTPCWESRGTSKRRLCGAGHPQAEGHGHEP